MDAMALVEDRVRDGVRVRGLDPQRDPEAVRDLVELTVAEVLSEWSTEHDALPADAATLTQHAFSAVAGFGPLQRFFDDPEIEELWNNDRLAH
ncbi:MAG: hypothetical protein PSX37_02515 [bacterium]|nr:hypothetical protein [bacterium]